jgi:hypothetical protein
MAQIISHREEACGAPYIELTACRNSVDPDLIVLAWRPVDGEPLAWESASTIDRDTPNGFAEREIRRVLGHADRLGIRFVLINDPEGLIPGSGRYGGVAESVNAAP